ncbi:MAG: hypothetical protein U0N02_01195 [Clostridia bacterium]
MKEKVQRIRRKSRRNTVIAIRFIFFLICLIVMCSIILTNVIARYRSEAVASKNIDIAMYVFQEDHQTMTFKLDNMVPRSEPYQYTFSVTNTDSNNKIAQTTIEYDITIKTTTNIPLQYVLYKNQTPTSTNPTNILTGGNALADTDGTYFKKFTTATQTLTHSTEQTDVYYLLVYFPETYKSQQEYQSMIESIEIMLDSKQKI